MAIHGVHLGLPMWGFKEWAGTLYTSDAPARDYLRQYAEVFTAVEGNTTFYSVPARTTVERWREATPRVFRFCFKFPREVTHRGSLSGRGRAVGEFLSAVGILRERLGPLMVQLPASYRPEALPELAGFLARLPGEFRYAVELRHAGFHEGATKERLEEVLRLHGCERVILDTRPLSDGPADHPEVVVAQHPKPALPVEPEPLSEHPFLRFIGHPVGEVNGRWLRYWSGVVAGWLRRGLEPYVFLHCPNNVHSPGLARRFHRLLVEEQGADVGVFPPFPGEDRGRSGAEGQMSLFG